MIARLVAIACACACTLACGDDGGPPASTIDGSDTAATTDASTSSGTDVGWDVALEVGQDVGAFLSAWGPTADRLYVVGGQEPAEPGPTTGAMMRWDGTQWSAVELPAGTPKLNWIHGVGEHRFVVGELGTVLHRIGDDDDTPWEVDGCETNLELWGVWAAAPDDVWAVGGDGFSRPPVLCRWSGNAWTLVELPPLSVMSRALFKVWGASSDAVWAVGHRGLVLHWDGQAWSEQPSGTNLDLISLWGTGPDDVLAVGGRSDSVIVRWDGTRWQAAEMFGPAGLNGIWMADDGASTIVGTMGRIDTVAPTALEVVPDVSPTTLALHAVFGVSGQRFAVGGSLDLSPPFTGIVLVHR